MSGRSFRGLRVVNRARDELLARPRFAGEQHGGLDRRDLTHLTQHRAQRGALADDVVEPTVDAELILEIRVLDLQSTLVTLELPKQRRALDRDRGLVGEDAKNLELLRRDHARREISDRPDLLAVHLQRISRDADDAHLGPHGRNTRVSDPVRDRVASLRCE